MRWCFLPDWLYDLWKSMASSVALPQLQRFNCSHHETISAEAMCIINQHRISMSRLTRAPYPPIDSDFDFDLSDYRQDFRMVFAVAIVLLFVAFLYCLSVCADWCQCQCTICAPPSRGDPPFELRVVSRGDYISLLLTRIWLHINNFNFNMILFFLSAFQLNHYRLIIICSNLTKYQITSFKTLKLHTNNKLLSMSIYLYNNNLQVRIEVFISMRVESNLN